jgi:hypothetical protein
VYGSKCSAQSIEAWTTCKAYIYIYIYKRKGRQHVVHNYLKKTNSVGETSSTILVFDDRRIAEKLGREFFFVKKFNFLFVFDLKYLENIIFIIATITSSPSPSIPRPHHYNTSSIIVGLVYFFSHIIIYKTL